MAAIRIISGTAREVWQEAVPLLGGTSRTITTGIKAHNVLRSHAFGLLIINSLVNAPSITATLSVVGGVYVVTVANVGAGASSAAYTLDITRVNSPQQGRDPSAPGQIHVIAAGSAVSGGGGTPQTSSVGRTIIGDNRTSGSSGETIIFEELVDFDRITGVGTTIDVTLSGIGWLMAAPGTGIVTVYVGATAPGDTTGSTMRCGMLVTLPTEEKLTATGIAFANPGGQLLVQVTLQNANPPEFTYFRGYTIGIG